MTDPDLSPTAQRALLHKSPMDAIDFLRRMGAMPYEIQFNEEVEESESEREETRDDGTTVVYIESEITITKVQMQDEKELFTPHKCEVAILQIRLAVAEGRL